jgi:type II secretory pathway predicted ATPase ExeA
MEFLMYEEFYQLTANPFRLAPDPDFCFSHSGYQNAREYLEYALEQGEGFVMVTGRPGTGKTLLVETFLREIDANKVVAKRIAVSSYGADELLRAVAHAYDIDVAELDKATLRHRIQEFFIEQEQAGRRVLLIMDEAQALQHSALEELRILADLQTQSRTMLQLFLVGQDSLQALMSTPDMEQFQQRVIANYHLMPLDLLEARAYIEHRLLHAGWSGDPEFTSAAVLSVYQLSKGVPRHINKICNRLMLLGFGKGSYIFDQEDAQAIAAEMFEEQLTPMASGRTLLADADSIPEIRDGLISFDDLAIRVDKVDARAFAISEATRLAALKKKQFIERHHDDPATWYPHTASPAEPLEDAVAVTTEQLSGASTPVPDDLHYGGHVAKRFLRRFSRRELSLAAMLAITTVSIAALPSIFGRAPGEETVSASDNQSRVIQDVVDTGQSGITHGTVIVEVEDLPASLEKNTCR